MNIHIGDTIAGKHVVEGFLGAGGMGFVVAARHKDLGELRAIKIMSPASLGDREAQERFFREAKAMARLKSVHAVRVYESGRNIDGSPFIVMEYLEGKDLRTIAKERGMLPPDEAVLYVLQACDALIEAHKKGIVHRDIKPANLFLTTGAHGEPCVKVLDFGIAKLESPFQSEQANDLTQAAQFLGTANYSSPEQMLSGRDVDGRTDIWAMGVVLYKLVTGELPYSANKAEELRHLVLSQTPIVPPSHFNALVTPAFDAVLFGALEHSAARRYPTIDAFAAALEPFAPAWYRPPSRRLPMPSVSDGGDATKTQLLPETSRARTVTNVPREASAPWFAQPPASVPTLPSALTASNPAETVRMEAHVQAPSSALRNATLPMHPAANAFIPPHTHVRVGMPAHVSTHSDTTSRDNSRTDAAWTGQPVRRDVHQHKDPWRFVAMAVGGVCLALIALVVWVVLRTTSTTEEAKGPATPEAAMTNQPAAAGKPIVVPAPIANGQDKEGIRDEPVPLSPAAAVDRNKAVEIKPKTAHPRAATPSETRATVPKSADPAPAQAESHPKASPDSKLAPAARAPADPFDTDGRY